MVFCGLCVLQLCLDDCLMRFLFDEWLSNWLSLALSHDRFSKVALVSAHIGRPSARISWKGAKELCSSMDYRDDMKILSGIMHCQAATLQET